MPRSGGWTQQCADVAVAQRVVHVVELVPGGGDVADVAAAAVADPVAELPDAGGAGRICTDSTAAQRTSREPCLVIRPRCTWVSDSWCFGVSPAHEASCAAAGNR